MQEINAEISHFREWLELVIKARFNGKWTHFARESGLAAGSVNNYLKGLTYPGYKQLARICEYSGANANWLLTGRGPMLQQVGASEVGQPLPAER